IRVLVELGVTWLPTAHTLLELRAATSRSTLSSVVAPAFALLIGCQAPSQGGIVAGFPGAGPACQVTRSATPQSPAKKVLTPFCFTATLPANGDALLGSRQALRLARAG